MNFIMTNLKEYILSTDHRIYSQLWYHGCYSDEVFDYNISVIGKARFALKDRGVRFFVNNSPQRIDYEIGIVGRVQHISGAFTVCAETKIIDLDRFAKDEDSLKDFIDQRGEDIYLKTSDFATEVLNSGVDGILYSPCDIIDDPMGLGPVNNPMLVLFESILKSRVLYESLEMGM